MSREPRTERHLSLSWADQIDAQRRAAAHPRIQAATPLQLAILQHMTHGAGALADPGTESFIHQALSAHPPTQEHPMQDGFAHLPAALIQPGELPPPIPFPARPATARTTEPSESTRQRWARMGKLVDTAKAEGHAAGLQQGYTQGWRWGLWCGAVGGALLASLAWAVWLTVTAPDAAPPSARPTVATRL